MPSPQDRRSEQRHAGHGTLKLSFDDPAPQEVNGELLDYNTSGFRAEHPYTALSRRPGSGVPASVAVGRARVMWNRIANDRVETGFLVIK